MKNMLSVKSSTEKALKGGVDSILVLEWAGNPLVSLYNMIFTTAVRANNTELGSVSNLFHPDMDHVYGQANGLYCAVLTDQEIDSLVDKNIQFQRTHHTAV